MTAAEPTPLERVYDALATAGVQHAQLRVHYANTATIALLVGDWLERVLGEHEWVGMLDECACGWDEGFRPKKRHPAHQAAAIRAAAGVGL